MVSSDELNSVQAKRRRGPRGWIVGGMLLGMACAMVKGPEMGEIPDVGRAHILLVWAIVGCVLGCFLSLIRGRGQFEFRQMFELTFTVAIIAMLWRAYSWTSENSNQNPSRWQRQNYSADYEIRARATQVNGTSGQASDPTSD